MIKKLKFLLLCLISSFELRGMNSELQGMKELLPKRDDTDETVNKLRKLIKKNNNLAPIEEIYTLLEKGSNLKVKPAFPLWEKIKAIILPSYPIPNKTLIEESTEIYFEDNQDKNKMNEETKKNHKKALINTVYLITLDQKALIEIKNKNIDQTAVQNTLNADFHLISLKFGFIEKYRGYALLAGGAIVGCIIAHSLVRNLELQPATLIEDEKIIPLGIKGICIQLIGFLNSAMAGGMLEWKILSTSIASKLIEKLNLKKETIKNKMTDWEKSPEESMEESSNEEKHKKDSKAKKKKIQKRRKHGGKL